MLAYQSFGVVYGDLSVSPLYVFRNTFSGELRGHMREDEILGVLSLIFWTLTLVPVVKYALIVLNADDNGEGAALSCFKKFSRIYLLSGYSGGYADKSPNLLCRGYICVVFGAMPARQAELDPQPAKRRHGGLHVQIGGAAGHAARSAGAEAPGESPVSQSWSPGHRVAGLLHGDRRWRPHPVNFRYPNILPATSLERNQFVELP